MATDFGPCTVCSCTNYSPHAFVKARCNNCMHLHTAKSGSTSEAAPARPVSHTRDSRRSFVEPAPAPSPMPSAAASDAATKPGGPGPASTPSASRPGAPGRVTSAIARTPAGVAAAPADKSAPADATASPVPGKKPDASTGTVPPGGTPVTSIAARSAAFSAGHTPGGAAATASPAAQPGTASAKGKSVAAAPPAAPSTPARTPVAPAGSAVTHTHTQQSAKPGDSTPVSAVQSAASRVAASRTPAATPVDARTAAGGTPAPNPAESAHAHTHTHTPAGGAAPAAATPLPAVAENAPDFETHFTSVAAVVQAIESKKRARRNVMRVASADIQARYKASVARIRGCVSANSQVLVETLVEMLRANASEIDQLTARAHAALDRMPKGVVGTNALLRDMNTMFATERGTQFTERDQVPEFITQRRQQRVAELTAAQEVLLRAYRHHSARMRTHGRALAEISSNIAAEVLHAQYSQLPEIAGRFARALARLHVDSRIGRTQFLEHVAIPTRQDVYALVPVRCQPSTTGPSQDGTTVCASADEVASRFKDACDARSQVLLQARNRVAAGYRAYRQRLTVRSETLAQLLLDDVAAVQACQDKQLPSILEHARAVLARVPQDRPGFGIARFTEYLRTHYAEAATADVRTLDAAMELVKAAIGARMGRLDRSQSAIRKTYNRWIERVVAKAIAAGVRAFRVYVALLTAADRDIAGLLASLQGIVRDVPGVFRARVAFITTVNACLGLHAHDAAIGAFRNGSVFAVIQTLYQLSAASVRSVPPTLVDSMLSSPARLAAEEKEARADSAVAEADSAKPVAEVAAAMAPDDLHALIQDARSGAPAAERIQKLLAQPAHDRALAAVHALVGVSGEEPVKVVTVSTPLASAPEVYSAAVLLAAHRFLRLEAAARRVQQSYRAYHRALGAMSAAYAALVAGAMRDLDRALDRELEALASRAAAAITKVSAGQSRRLREAYFLTELNRILHAEAEALAAGPPVSQTKYTRVFRDAYRAELRASAAVSSAPSI